MGWLHDRMVDFDGQWRHARRPLGVDEPPVPRRGLAGVREGTWTVSGRGLTRTASCILLGVLVATSFAAPAAQAASSARPCRVRNVTQGTQGDTLKAMVAESHDGDELRVRGRCRTAIIRTDITIRGVDDDAVLHGHDRYRVLQIKAGAIVTIRHLRIAHGSVNSVEGHGGAGILNGGTLTLIDTVVSRNSTGEEWGGGINNDGTLTLIDTFVRRNIADWGAGIANSGSVLMVRSSLSVNGDSGIEGGGIWNYQGTVTLRDSSVVGNTATKGGGIYNSGQAGLITLVRARVRRNTAGSGGGIFNVDASVDLQASTVSANVVQGGQGGGILNRGHGTVALDADSSVTGNTPDDCVGTPAC
jgi:hypothetical protein